MTHTKSYVSMKTRLIVICRQPISFVLICDFPSSPFAITNFLKGFSILSASGIRAPLRPHRTILGTTGYGTWIPCLNRNKPRLLFLNCQEASENILDSDTCGRHFQIFLKIYHQMAMLGYQIEDHTRS